MSRMDRYESSKASERTEKNKKLYETVTNIDVDYIDVNNATVIKNNYNNNKLTRSEYRQKKELDKLIKIPQEEVKELHTEEKPNDRIYDINEILKLARENKLFENDDKKRLINTEYNILTKLDISSIEDKDTSKENLRELIDTIYGNSDKPKKQEKTSIGGLLDDLMVEEPVLSEETSKDILDKEEKEEETKEEETKEEIKEEIKEESKEIDEQEDITEENDFLDEEISRSRKVLVFIIILVVIIISVIGYLFYKYFL